jgi:hypothetical protein
MTMDVKQSFDQWIHGHLDGVDPIMDAWMEGRRDGVMEG